MFENWGFLIAEMMVLICLAALIGLVAGWLIWGQRTGGAHADAAQLRRDLERCQARHADKDARIATLASDLAALQTSAAKSDSTKTAASGKADGQKDQAGQRPEALAAARDGAPDDLKQIKGIGPKLEALCNALGFYHFDQIAGWSDAEIAWVDENLEGFKGRVSRDDWVAQAKTLAAGGATAFSDKVKDGDVYE